MTAAYLRTALNWLLLAIALLLPVLAVAQDDSGSSMDRILQSAKDSGMQVIVINPDGSTEQPKTEEVTFGGLQGSVLMTSQERFAEFRSTLRERLQVAPVSLEEVVFIANGQSPTGHYSAYFGILFWSLLFLVLSELAVREIYGKRIVGPWLESLQIDEPVGYSDKLPILLLRTVIGVVGLSFVVVISYTIGYGIFGGSDDGTVRLTVAYIYLTYVVAKGVVFLWRMILSPYLESYRIPKFSNSDARKLYYWLLTVATLSVIVINFLNWIEELGLSYNVYALMSSGLTFIMVLLNVAMVLANRRAISNAIMSGERAEETTFGAAITARAWAPVVIVYFFVAWAEMTYRLVLAETEFTPLLTGFYYVLITILVVYGIVGFLIERIFRRRQLMAEWQAQRDREQSEEEEDEDPAEEEETPDPPARLHSLRTFEDLSRRVANILAVTAGIWAITQIWQIDIGMEPSSHLAELYDVIAIVFIGYVIYHAVRIWIDQKIKDEGGDDIEVAPGDEGGAGGASRLATLLPLFRNFLLTIIFIAFGMIVLTNIGINVSALFAGAGVVGLAIGFGAQALVRDIFSGAFFLFDDAFRKGEYIDIGEVKGTVEKISVRSFQLRHHLGPLHTVPFGEIQHLTNFSRDWVMMKLPLRVTYDTDVEKVRKLVKKLGLELAEDPLIGDQFLQPLKSQGVIEMQDSAMIIRVKFMTRPGDQWVLRKRVYQEIRDLFEREGIKFAHREVTVRLAGDKAENLTEQQKEAVGAAALASMDEDVMDDALDDDR